MKGLHRTFNAGGLNLLSGQGIPLEAEAPVVPAAGVPGEAPAGVTPAGGVAAAGGAGSSTGTGAGAAAVPAGAPGEAPPLAQTEGDKKTPLSTFRGRLSNAQCDGNSVAVIHIS